MNDTDRVILDRLDRLQSQLAGENWRRDMRLDIVSRRITAIGSWLLSGAVLGVGLGVGYAFKHSADYWDAAGWVVLGLICWGGIHGAAKSFLKDAIADEDRRELNEQRRKDGLEPIRDPTVVEDLLGFIFLLLIFALVIGIVGGIAAIAIDLLFLSKSFGMVAQVGTASAVVGFLGFGLISMIGDLAAWNAKQKARRRAR
jgi:hypothetical protein